MKKLILIATFLLTSLAYSQTLTITGDVTAQGSLILSDTEPVPSSQITVVSSHNSLGLTWTDIQQWDYPWIIQRSTSPLFADPTDMTNNQSTSTFRFLGINANNYVDIEDLAEGTTYYYRVGVVTNLSEHYRNAATPTFAGWLYGNGTTTTLPAGQKLTYDITNATYAGGAVAGDGLNDYPAILAALTAAEAAGGGIIYCPAGVYDIWPTDADVDIVGGYPEIESGETASSVLFPITSDNITFLGDVDGAGAPSTFWNFFLWGKEPATKWLNVLSGGTGSAVANVRRYYVFKPYDVESITIKNLDVDMGAVPVNTGKDWYTLDNKRYEWDITHKFWAAHDTTRHKDLIIYNVDIDNCRGEMVYIGGSSEKTLIKNCEFSYSNSSTVSCTADVEIVDSVFRDGANSAVESVLFTNRNGLDGTPFPMNHIMRGSTLIGLDQSGSGVMKSLPGNKSFVGWYCFNSEGTYQSVTDSVFTDTVMASFAPWYEYRNGLRFNNTFNLGNFGLSGNTSYTWTYAQYGLTGGFSNVLWMGDTVYLYNNRGNGQALLYTQPYGQAEGSQTPWIWDAVHLDSGDGGSYTFNRIWLDTWSYATGRDNVTFSNFTKDEKITLGGSYLYDVYPAQKIHPTYVNFFE